MSNIREKLKEAVKLTLEYHETLNPKLWDGQTLKSEVAKKLLMIAQTWAGFAKIPVKAISDIIVVGGNANYNYTPFSDIDLHVVVDIEKLPECNGLFRWYRDWETDRKSTRLNSSHSAKSRMPSSA